MLKKLLFSFICVCLSFSILKSQNYSLTKNDVTAPLIKGYYYIHIMGEAGDNVYLKYYGSRFKRDRFVSYNFSTKEITPIKLNNIKINKRSSVLKEMFFMAEKCFLLYVVDISDSLQNKCEYYCCELDEKGMKTPVYIFQANTYDSEVGIIKKHDNESCMLIRTEKLILNENGNEVTNRVLNIVELNADLTAREIRIDIEGLPHLNAKNAYLSYNDELIFPLSGASYTKAPIVFGDITFNAGFDNYLLIVFDLNANEIKGKAIPIQTDKRNYIDLKYSSDSTSGKIYFYCPYSIAHKSDFYSIDMMEISNSTVDGVEIYCYDRKDGLKLLVDLDKTQNLFNPQKKAQNMFVLKNRILVEFSSDLHKFDYDNQPLNKSFLHRSKVNWGLINYFGNHVVYLTLDSLDFEETRISVKSNKMSSQYSRQNLNYFTYVKGQKLITICNENKLSKGKLLSRKEFPFGNSLYIASYDNLGGEKQLVEIEGEKFLYKGSPYEGKDEVYFVVKSKSTRKLHILRIKK